MDMTCQQAASKWRISPRRVQILCGEGRIAGARRIGRAWLIPADAEKPRDARKPDAAPVCPYWPEILQLDSHLMRLPGTQEILRQPMDDLRRQLLIAEMAYLQGDYSTARQLLQDITPDSPAYLCALSVSTAASAALGEGTALLSAYAALCDLLVKYRQDRTACMLVEMTQGLLYATTFSAAQFAPWLLNGVLEGLPPAARPMVIYVRAKGLLSLGKIDRAIGAIEAALSLLSEHGGVIEGYLWILLAQAQLYAGDGAQAKQAMHHAMDVFLPKGFLSPIAEYVTQMMGLIEQCLQESYPQLLPSILKLYHDMANRWRNAHNLLTQEHLTTLLTRREYQIAAGIATGMSNQQSAQQLGISLSTLKGHLQTVYQKLGITSRKELKDFILPKETPSK